MRAYGRVTVEAMMNDCVVIGRNSGGTSELIEHEETGFLFDSNSELEALMEKVWIWIRPLFEIKRGRKPFTRLRRRSMASN